MIPRLIRCALAPFLFFLLWAAPGPAQTSADAERIYERLSKLPADAEIEVRLQDGTRLLGMIERFDRSELVLRGRPEPIPLLEIQKVKRVRARQGPRWNPATGFVRSWKMAAVAGAILALGIFAAYNTK